MKESIKNRKKNLLALCLSLLMVTSAGAAFASCGDSVSSDSSSSVDSSSSSATSEVQDNSDALITNSQFEVVNDNDGKNVIVTSVTGWTRSVNSVASGTALSSKTASGIIDITDAGWKNLTGTSLGSMDAAASLTEEQAIEKWDTLTAYDKLKFYEAWEAANSGKTLSTDFSKYEALNIKLRDIPDIANPGTHDGDQENKKILMIHNDYPEKKDTDTVKKTTGTAQKWTSSSTVTVSAGTSAEFSVWVKTADLKSSSSSETSQDAIGKGAYISITQSVGGTKLDAFEVKNINTENMDGLEDTNGWKQYKFYLKGSSFADTTFSVVLGLGQGGGTDRLEYVNGYAFFDDIECQIIDNDTFDEAAKNIENIAVFDSEKTQKTIDAYTSTQDVFAMDFYGEHVSTTSVSDNVFGALNIAPTETDGYNAQNAPWLGDGLSNAGDVTAVFDNTAALDASGNKYQQAVYDNYFKDTTFTDNDKVLLLLSANGVAYEAASNYEFKFKADKNYMVVSFFVKTSDMNGVTGAGITLVDQEQKTSFTGIDTTDIAPVKVGDNEDVYEGWQKCYFFVENKSEIVDASFKLTFNVGPTSITTSTTKDSFQSGFAAFTKLEAYYLTESEFNSASNGTYAKIVSVENETEDKAAGNNGFDSAAGSPTDAIKAGIANPQNYKGVYNDNYRVSLPVAGESAAVQELKRQINNHANAGLVNKEYFEDYDVNATWYKGLQTLSGKTEAKDIWDWAFGDATQPLLIWNNSARENLAYGYIGNAKTIAANNYTAISVRVKASAGATASVYLIDMNDTDRQTTLSIGSELIYWYDKDGNICTEDPAEKSSVVAFKLDAKTGLYTANKNWSGYASLTKEQKTGYFANLSNYEKDSATGNLLVKEGGSAHTYNNEDYTWNREAFYAKDGKYYADKNYKTLVYNLADVSALEARYTANAKQDLSFVVTGTGDWQTVTFYIHTGDVAKNYRLEVWSGTRDGKTVNAKDSFVIFDTNSPIDSTNTAESNFKTYTGLVDTNDAAVKSSFESVFSYFDSASFLRYASELDVDKVGNLYENSYTYADQTSGVAYMLYEDNNYFVKLADFALSEINVEPEVIEEETSSEESSTEEESGINLWMLISSIAVAAVLVIAVISIAIQKILKKARRSKSAKARVTHVTKASVKKATKKVEKAEDNNDSPYND